MAHNGLRDFQPLLARTRSIHHPVSPIAYDCVKFIVVRDGSAILFSEFGQRPVKVGDVVLLGANVLCGSEPESHITTTTIYISTEYALDQIFWQYAAILSDRLAAQQFADEFYSEPAQILHLGEDRAGLLMPWLDEMVMLSTNGQYQKHFHRMHALWYAIADVLIPFVRVSPERVTPTQRLRSVPRHQHRFAPLRGEVRRAAELLEERPEYPWTLNELANSVHLSASQFGRVFADAYGLTPLAFQRMIRTRRLAELLRDTDLPIEVAMRQVGWFSRGHAAHLFQMHVGLTPTQYRARIRSRE